MHDDRRGLRRTVTGIAAMAVLSSGLAAGATATAAEPPPAADRNPEAQALLLDQLQLLVRPLLEGLGQVGSLLTVTKPEWNFPLDLVDTDIAWLCNGTLIPGTEGMWEFVPTEMQQGCEVAARVTGTLLGLLPLEYITNALQIPGVGQEAQTPQATTMPAVSGDPTVGSTLTATDPQWDMQVSAQETTYQWLRNGVPIAGATARTYTVAVEDVGRPLSVKVTATKGEKSGSATSPSVTGKPGAAIAPSIGPGLSGTALPGSTLSANPGAWGAPAPTFTYEWLRDDVVVPGRTGSTYLLSGQDVGKRIAVRVTATRTGYLPGRATSTPVTVDRAGSTTKAALVRKKVRAKQKALLAVTLVPSAAGLRAAGKVAVRDGRTLLRTYRVRAKDNGRRTLTLPKLKPGKHRLRVEYAGSRTVAGSTSKVVVLTVRK